MNIHIKFEESVKLEKIPVEHYENIFDGSLKLNCWKKVIETDSQKLPVNMAKDSRLYDSLEKLQTKTLAYVSFYICVNL